MVSLGGLGGKSGESSGSGNSLFDQIQGKKGEEKGTGKESSLEKTQEKYLGPSYNYVAHIKTPKEMDMSSEGSFDALADNIGGLLGYIDLLVSGQGKLGVASKIKNPDGSFTDYPHPLGNKFFLRTAVKCKDKAGKKHDRYIYINNVPDGSIPIVSNMDNTITFNSFKGLLPGVLSNLSQIHPMQILSSFVSGSSPRCQAVTMEIVDAKTNKKKMDTQYLTNEDISIMPPGWFPAEKPQSSYKLKDSFSNMNEDESDESDEENEKKDYSKMPDDILIKIYYSMLGLLGIYILLKLMMKKK
jgi:hypothetical protein